MASSLLPFRLYVSPGCPWCSKAESRFQQAGVPFESVLAGGDPILNTGLAVAFPGKPPQFPILVSFLSGEVIVGFKEEDYERLINAYRAGLGASVPDGSAAEQLSVSSAPAVSESPTPQGS